MTPTATPDAPAPLEKLDPSSGADEAIEVLTRALRGRVVPGRRQRAAEGRASPAEGLALVQSFIAIEDRTLRQALLDAVAALAG